MSVNPAATEKAAPAEAAVPQHQENMIHEAPTGQSEPVISPVSEPAPIHQAQPSNAPAPANDGLPNYEQAKNAPYVQPAAAMNQGAVVVPLNQLYGESPQPIDCPFCHRRSTTMINKEGSSMQIVVGAVFCLVCICLACVPCIAGWFENIEYRCSQCRNMVALRRHDGPMEVFGPPQTVYSQYSNQQPMGQNGQAPQTKQPEQAHQPHHQPQQQPQQQVQEHQPQVQSQTQPQQQQK